MGKRNFLVEGVSGTGKTSVCHELRRRGFQAVNGDTDLAYQGDPVTGEPRTGPASHWHHVWRVDRVRDIAADDSHELTFLCGGSRNFTTFLDLFDEVFVLDVDPETLRQRLAGRGDDEYGGTPEQLAFVLQLQRTREDTPAQGVRIDATAPLEDVVDEIVRHARATH